MKAPRLLRCVVGVVLVVACGVWSVVAAAEQDLPAYAAERNASLSTGQRRIASSLRAMAGMVAPPEASVAGPLANRAVPPSQEGFVEVYVYTHILTQTEIQALQQRGTHIYQVDQQARTIYAAVTVDALETVAALSFVRWIGLPSRSLLRTGSVTSAADTVLRAAEARSMFGIDGSGVRVGIVSDSLLNLQDSVASGDLPPDVNILDAGDMLNGIDEGRALAEIIHDLAPGATLLFHSGFPNSMSMARAIRALVDAGAHIILDDIGFLDQPVFEDGDVAQAVQDAINSGVVYVTATGNDATQHYRAIYQEFDPNDGDPNDNFHDFGGGDATMAIAINPGDQFIAVLQWPDRFDGSANTANYDLLIRDANGRTSACNQAGMSGMCASTDDQLNSNAPPVEIVFVNNTSNRTVTVTLLINRVAGAALPLALNFNRVARLLEHNIASGSVYGHSCVREALSVGAINASDPGFATIEPFSSRGPCEVFFPTLAVRTKPDVVAADGVRTSVPGFEQFFGTSPAAPHVAAIVALLIDAAGGPGRLSNTQLANTIRLSANDRGEPEHDNTFGHGAVDAVAAVLAVQALLAGNNSPPQSTIDTPAADLVVTPGTAVTFQGACIDIESNGPFAVTWDFGAVAALSPLPNPAPVIFPTPGVFPIVFTCVDANGVPDPSPATRTITVNQAPSSSIVSPSADSTITAGSSMDFAGACGDEENNAPFAFLWFFGSGATIASSTEQNPQDIQFNTVGTFIVTFICTDALGLTDLLPALVQIRHVWIELAAPTIPRTLRKGAGADEPPDGGMVAPEGTRDAIL